MFSSFADGPGGFAAARCVERFVVHRVGDGKEHVGVPGLAAARGPERQLAAAGGAALDTHEGQRDLDVFLIPLDAV